MKAYIFFDTARPEGASYDLLIGSDETERGMCEEVDIPEEQFADWQFVLGQHPETHKEFARVQREMSIALDMAKGPAGATPKQVEANSDDPADWWKKK